MTTPTPDVQEIAAKALSNEIDDGFLSWNGCLALADAVLSAVTPVIERYARRQVAVEIDRYARDRECNGAPEAAVRALKDAVAIARSHVQHRTGDDHE